MSSILLIACASGVGLSGRPAEATGVSGYANLCTDLGVTLPTLTPLPAPLATGLPLIDASLDGLRVGVNANLITALSAAPLALTGLGAAAQGAVTGGNCRVAASGLAVDNQNGLALGGGQITGLGGTGSLVAIAGDVSAIAIGNGAMTALGAVNAVALGANANAIANNGLALGANASSLVSGGVALGAGSIASRGAIALTTDPLALAGVSRSVATTTGAVSIGALGSERQLINVAAGTQASDAVNVGQVAPLVVAINAQNAIGLANGTSVAAALGGGAGYNAATGAVSAPSFVVDGTTYTTVAAALGAAAAGGAGPVQYSTSLAPTVANVGVAAQDATLVGPAGGGPVTLHNLGGGALTLGSTDAVNGGQVGAIGTNVALELGGGAAFNTATGALSAPSYVVGGASYGNVGAAIGAQGVLGAMTGTSVAAALGGAAAYNPATGAVSTPSFVVGGSTYTNVAAAIGAAAADGAGVVQYSTAGAPTTANTGVTSQDATLVGLVPGAPVVLHNLGAGALTVASTDAVNGGQLNATGSSLATGLGGGAAFNTATGMVSAPAYLVGGVGYGNVGAALAAQGGLGATSGGSVAAALGGTSTYNAATGAISAPSFVVGGATYTNVTAAIDAAATDAGGAVQYSTPTSPTSANAGVVSQDVTLVGSVAGAPVTLHNLGAGALTVASTDAVNGGQLNAAASSVASALGGGSAFNTATGAISAPAYVVGGATYNTVGSAFDAQGALGAATGSSLASALGGAAAYNAATGAISAPNYVIAGNTYNTVGAAVAALANVASTSGDGVATAAKYFHANSSGADSVASGLNAVAIGVSDTAVGAGALSSGSNAVAYNSNATALGANAIAGSSANGQADTNNTAVGANSMAVGEAATAIGSHAQAMGQQALALGTDTTATNASTAVGVAANAAAFYSVAIGTMSHAGDPTQSNYFQAAVAVGVLANAMGNATAIGNASNAAGESSVALGQSSTAMGAGSTSIGLQAMAGSDNSVAIGASAVTNGGSAVAVGYQNSATGNGAVAVGDPDVANGEGAVAVGENDTAMGTGAVALGDGVSALGQGAVALGYNASAQAPGGLAFGDTASAALQDDVALGTNAQASGGGSIALGAGAVATHAQGVALGAGSLDGANDNTSGTIVATNSATLGYANDGNSVLGAVSVGSPGAYRQIQRVADGSAPHDAVTVEQLSSVVTQTDAAITRTNQNLATLAAYTATLPGGGSGPGATGAAGTTGGTGSTGGMGSTGTPGAAGAPSGPPAVVPNVLQGSVAPTSTDAVNGAQLYATNTTVTNLAGAVANLATTDGRLATRSTQGAATATGVDTVALGPASRASGVGALALGTDAVSSGVRSVAIGAGSTDAGQAGVVSVGAAGAERRIVNVAAGAIKAGSTDAVNGSQLYVVAQQSRQAVQYDVDGLGGRTNSITLSGGATNLPVAISNLAGGALTATSSQAVNGSQLYATNQAIGVAQGTASSALSLAQNAVQYDDATRGSVTLDAGALPATLHNVAAGVATTDAANVGQVNAAMGAAVAQSAAYTDQRVNQVISDVWRVKADAYGAAAGALAAAGLPQAHDGHRNLVGMAVGTWGGQAAYAVGLSRISDDDRWVVKASVSFSTQGQGGVSAGVGYSF